MSDFLARQIREVSQALEKTGGRLVASVAIALVAILALVAGLAFLAVALFLEIASLAGSVIAALAVGGGFVVVALICALVLRLRRSHAPRQSPQQAKAEAARAQTRAELGAKIDESVAPLLSALHEANMKPEEVALRLGTELTKQTGPFGLVALALAAGFIVSRRLKGAKKS